VEQAELEAYIAQGYSTYQIADTVHTSQTNVRYWLKKYNLKTKPKRRIVYRCGKCGETDPSKFYGRKGNICGKCHNQYTIAKGRDLKQRVRDLLGRKCATCGYDRFQVALDIHHTNRSQKSPNFRTMRGWAWERVVEEVETCILLYRNCHAAYHVGLLSIDDSGV